MFSKNLALSLCSSLFLFLSYSFSASGSLLTDPDGLNVSLFDDGSLMDNRFGPDSFTMGYDPGPGGFFGDTLPSPIGDGSEMNTRFFANSITFSQFATSTVTPFTLGWTMTIDDIDWPEAHEIVSADIVSSTYLTDFSLDFTANSLTVRYDGGDLGSLLETGTIWEGTITFDTAKVEVPVPALLSLLLLGCLGACLSKRSV